MAGKNKSLGLKQKKLVKALTKANSVAEAGRIAGYGTRESTHRALKSIQEKIPDLMRRIGADDEYLLATTLERSKSAMRTEVSQSNGIFMDEKVVEDGPLRWRYHDALLKIRGLYKTPDNVGSDPSQAQHTGITLVVADERAAASIAQLLSAGSPNHVIIDVDARVDENVG